MPQGIGYPPGQGPVAPPPMGGAVPAPAAAPPPSPLGGGAQLTQQEFAILDAAFTPQVIRILQKVLATIEGGDQINALLEQFAASPSPAPLPPRPQTGLATAQRPPARQPLR